MQTDLISRSAVIDRIAEFLGPKGLDEWEVMVAIREIIENAPAIDAVPVVRCNRCKCCEQDTGFCQYWGGGNHWNGFCNNGVRMDEKEND